MKKLLIAIILIGTCISKTYAQESTKLPDDKGYIVKIGETAPDFTINFTDGSPSKKLSDLRGNIVMLQFTASWCSVCIKEMPHIEERIWKAFKNKGIYVFGVDRKERPEDVVKFAKKMKITYPLILDEDGKIFELFADAKAGVTRNVIIDKEGKIVFLTRLFDKNEFELMIKKIEGLLNPN